MADLVTRMRLESSEYDQKVKRAAQNLLEFEAQCRATGQSMNTLSKDNLEYVRNLGQMQTASKNVRGRISELSSAFTELSMQYKRLSDEEKKGEIGKALTASIDQLKGRITTLKKDLGDVNKEMGEMSVNGIDLKGALSQLGGQFGINSNLMDIVTKGTVAYTAAIGAAVTATISATKAFADYNSELSMQGQVTTVTTGVEGPAADRMTDRANAISKVYGADFREVINAANTLMTQFGQTGDQAMQLISDGMQGMISGDGPKLLSMIQQFTPSFRDAGISASQLVAIIHNSEGGIFTDQNMQAIVMGIRNIRLMTKQTSDALAKLGIDGADMTKKLNDGSMTIFEAMQQVSKAIDKTGGSTQAAGEVMQSVFGRQATMAGSKLGEAIATLNTDLEETKTQTGELGKSYAQLEQSTTRLNTAIRECFGYDGWQTMATGVKAELVDALTTVLKLTKEIKESWVGDIAGTIFDAALKRIKNVIKAARVVIATINKITGYREPSGDANGPATPNGGVPLNPANNWVFRNESRYGEVPKPSAKKKEEEEEIKPTPSTSSAQPMVTGGIKGVNEMVAATIYESMADLQQQLARYKAQLNNATNPFEEGEARQGIAATQWKMSDEGRMTAKLGWDQEQLDEVKAEMEESIGTITVGVQIDKVDNSGIKEMTTDAANMSKGWQAAARAVSSVGSALQSIDDPAAKIAGMIGQAIANIAIGFATATAKDSKLGVFGWIAAVAGGLSTMISTIAAIKSATAGSYAEGGIVPGNSFSGDNLTANVNSGELILNRSQQSNLADQLTSGESDGGDTVVRLEGEDLLISINTALRRRGYNFIGGDFS